MSHSDCFLLKKGRFGIVLDMPNLSVFCCCISFYLKKKKKLITSRRKSYEYEIKIKCEQYKTNWMFLKDRKATDTQVAKAIIFPSKRDKILILIL